MELVPNSNNVIISTDGGVPEVNVLELLRSHLRNRELLNEANNLSLENATDEEFIKMFFALKIYDRKKDLSEHTLRAYEADLETIKEFTSKHKLRLKDFGFSEVKAFNQEMRDRYANRSAVRKLDFFRRILEFGFFTKFYKEPLASWITKPSVAKGHYSDRKTDEDVEKNRSEIRELSEADARSIVALFPAIVRSQRYKFEYQKRNELLGMFLFRTGMRANEILGLNRGSFRLDREGNLVADVIGKGNKQRTVPIFNEVKKALIDYRRALEESLDIDPDDTSPLFFSIEDFRLYGVKKRLSYDVLYKVVKRVVLMAKKNPAISPHWFRHTFITTSLSKNIPLSIVKQVAGHADISTTNLYLERIEEDKIFDEYAKRGF